MRRKLKHNSWDIPAPRLSGRDLVHLRQLIRCSSSAFAELLSIKESAVPNFERSTSPLPSRLSDRIHTLRKYIALREALSKKRGRPKGATQETQKRIHLAAAFTRLGYKQADMAQYVYRDKAFDPKRNTRGLFCAYRSQIKSEQERLTPEEAKSIVDSLTKAPPPGTRPLG